MRTNVWKKSDSSTRYKMRYEMPRTTGWRFHTWSSGALLSLDDYSEATLNLGTTNTRLVGKHFEYDYALNRQFKRYYANGQLLATRLTQLGCPGTCDELTYVQGDHLGSTSTLTGTDRKVVAKERYSAFGERRRGETTLITDQLYTGQRLNVLSGLYHYSDGTSAGRFYDPLLARFVQADSVAPGSGSQGLNKYAYSLNNPVKYTDPNGKFPVLIAAAAVGGAALAYGFQVGTNMGQNPEMSFAQALTYNIDASQILAGAALGVTAVVAPPLVLSAASDALIGAGLLTGSTTVFSAGMATAEVAGGLTAAVFGVQAVGNQATTPTASSSLAPTPKEGETVYRVWGGEPLKPEVTDYSKAWGGSWTPINPATVQGVYRDVAGLPSDEATFINYGRFLSVGTLRDISGIEVRNALKLHGNLGGMLEYVIRDAEQKIDLIGVYGINPPF